ncbi:MAG: PilW family protein [Gammaproteobacteria bacterium]|nr:MAG: PilW family protein [Gammaproteobacteria bacterium]
MKSISKRHSNGFSLIELMISLTIGLIILGAVLMLFSNTKQSYDVQEDMAAIQENGRYAIRTLSDGLRLAGYMGITYDSIKISPQIYAGTITGACTATNWIDLGQPVFGANANSPTANANPYSATCIPAADYRAGTDVLVLRHANPDIATTYVANTLYVHSELDTGGFFVGNNPTAAATQPSANYAMSVNVYYIRPYAVNVGDGIPTLVRDTLTTGPAMTTQVIADGVENMQVTYGIDTTSPGDGIVDQYITAAAVTDWSQVMSVRVELLVRAPSVEGYYINRLSYPIGDITVPAANDQFRRKIFTTTIQIRNHRRAGT